MAASKTSVRFGFLAAMICVLGWSVMAHAQPGGPKNSGGVYLANNQYKLGIYADFTQYGVVIRGVEPGSAAERFGLESGDVIRSINGRSILSHSNYVQAMFDSGGFVELWVRNVRDGGMVRLSGSLNVPPQQGPIYGIPAGGVPRP